MWRPGLHGDMPSTLHTSTTELTASTQRTVVFATMGVYFVWHLVATATWPTTLGRLTWPITLIMAATCLLTLALLRRNLLAAHVLYQGGLVAAITLALYLFGRPELAWLYVLLPFIAAIVAGWRISLCIEICVGILVGLLSLGMLPASLSPTYATGIVLVGAFTGVLGVASFHTLLTAIHWSLVSYEQAQKNMEEARHHRGQLMHLLKELDQANYQLERANAALVAARKVAEDAERFKGEFVANVSHELRTPLNLIVGFTEMMATSPESYDNVELPGPYRSDMRAVFHSAQHLLELVDDVLDLARIEAGNIALVRDEVTLGALVDEAVHIVHDYITAKGLALRVDVSPHLPTLWIDRLRIRQTLLNLLVNAARYTKAGNISVRAHRIENEVVVEVTDSGPGIPEADLPKLFQEFRTTEQPTSAWHSGTGLGLPISKKFVELHHGRMGVESEQGAGARFWFTLPCPEVTGQRRPIGYTQRTEAIVRLGETERIVVVVHEDARVIPLLKRHIAGYQMVCSPTVEEGLRLAERIKAIAILSDRKEICSLPVGSPLAIYCPLPNARVAAANLGAQDLLVKPVSRAELLAALERLPHPIHSALIVDDDPTVVRLFRRMLRGLLPVQNCWEAYNGAEALHLLADKRPDVVLLDLVMPVVDGRTVLEQMGADPALAAVPVILVSARGADYTDLQLSAAFQLVKPEGFELGEVMRTLEATLNTLTPGWRALEGYATSA